MNDSNIPVAAPPPGAISNFSDPKTQSTNLIVLNTVFLSLMSMVVGIRLYSRAFLLHALGWDDCRCRALMLSKIELTLSSYVLSRGCVSLWKTIYFEF